MIPDTHKNNFNEMLRAAKSGDLCLLECNDKEGNPVYTICIAVEQDGGVETYPLARMFTYQPGDNPIDDLVPPEGSYVVREDDDGERHTLN